MARSLLSLLSLLILSSCAADLHVTNYEGPDAGVLVTSLGAKTGTVYNGYNLYYRKDFWSNTAAGRGHFESESVGPNEETGIRSLIVDMPLQRSSWASDMFWTRQSNEDETWRSRAHALEIRRNMHKVFVNSSRKRCATTSLSRIENSTKSPACPFARVIEPERVEKRSDDVFAPT